MSAAQMSNLQLRVISALVLAVVVLGLTWLGGFWFRALSAIIGAAMLYEWLAMSRPVSDSTNSLMSCAALGVVLVALIFDAPAALILAALAVGVVAVAVQAASGSKRQWPSTGLAYAGLSAISLAMLRGGDHAGLKAILFLFAVVWATDIAAYFVGRVVGGPKLAPAISPGKTQSGALGGAVIGVIAGVSLAAAMGSGQLVLLAFIALILSIISQIGDLFESWVKRQHGAKDSSQIIPGHGGVMDRVDGLVAAALALYLLGAASGGFDRPASVLFAG